MPSSPPLKVSRSLMLLILILIGSLCGLAAVAFHHLVEWASEHLIRFAQNFHGELRVALIFGIPVLAAIALTAIMRRFAPLTPGANLARVRRAYETDPSILDGRSVLFTLLLTPISLGSGAPLGPEGPTVVITSGIAKAVAERLRLSKRVIKGMIPVGTAAGIAAIFNTPITGVVFALEEILGTTSRGVLGGTIVAAVMAAVVERMLVGGKPLLAAPATAWHDVRELLGFALLGVIGGAVAGATIRVIHRVRRFDGLPPSPILRAAIGATLFAAIGFHVPSMFGVGYDTTSLFLHGGGDASSASIAFIAKLAGFIIAMSSGILGGTFAPSLFIGAALGAAVGHVAQQLLPHAYVQPGAFALVGMGAFFGGFLRCPIAAVLIVFEVTGDYGLILPLMLATALSMGVSQLFSHKSLTELQMHDEGFREHEASDDPLAGLSVADVMSRTPIAFAESTPMLDAARRVYGSRHRVFPVIDGQGRLVGILERHTIDETARDGRSDEPLSIHMVAPVSVATTLDLREAISLLAAASKDRAPVVDAEGKLVGFLSPSDVLRARVRRGGESSEAELFSE